MTARLCNRFHKKPASGPLALSLVVAQVFLFSCAPRQSRNKLSSPLRPASETTISKKLRNAPGPDQSPVFFLVTQERPAADPNQLRIYRLSAARLQIGKKLLPFLTFGADGLADYVQWEACPLTGESPCLKGTSAVSELILGHPEPGKYAIKARACVYKERSLSPERLCGPDETVDYLQDTSPKGEEDKLLSEIQSKEASLRSLGPTLYEVLRNFQEEIHTCKILGSSSETEQKLQEAQALKEVEIQVENLTGLGGDFLGESMGSVRLDPSDEKLAEILIETPTDPGASEAGYNPGGLSLAAASDSLTSYYDSFSYEWKFSGGTLISDLDHRKAILGSSGLVHPDSLQTTLGLSTGQFSPAPVFIPEPDALNAMDQRQRAAVFAGLLVMQNSGLNLLASENKDRFAISEMTRALLFLNKPKGLPSCNAWDHLQNNLATIRKNIRVTRDQLRLLEESMGKSRTKDAH